MDGKRGDVEGVLRNLSAGVLSSRRCEVSEAYFVLDGGAELRTEEGLAIC